jgi:hypothetical protein
VPSRSRIASSVGPWADDHARVRAVEPELDVLEQALERDRTAGQRQRPAPQRQAGRVDDQRGIARQRVGQCRQVRHEQRRRVGERVDEQRRRPQRPHGRRVVLVHLDRRPGEPAREQLLRLVVQLAPVRNRQRQAFEPQRLDDRRERGHAARGHEHARRRVHVLAAESLLVRGRRAEPVALVVVRVRRHAEPRRLPVGRDGERPRSAVSVRSTSPCARFAAASRSTDDPRAARSRLRGRRAGAGAYGKTCRHAASTCSGSSRVRR